MGKVLYWVVGFLEKETRETEPLLQNVCREAWQQWLREFGPEKLTELVVKNLPRGRRDNVPEPVPGAEAPAETKI